MKLLVFSHACATPSNQRLFGAIEDLSGWSVTLIGPETWRDDYGTTRQFERHMSFHGEIRTAPIWFNGHVPLHIYRTGFRNVLREIRPTIIFMHHEPYALATAQVYLANHLWHGCPIGFFTWQNLEKTYPLPIRQMEKMVYRQSTFAFVGSESAEARLRGGGYRERATLLPGSIDPTVHQPASDTIRLRRKLGFDPHDRLIGFMGRISEAKGLSTALEALHQLPERNWRLVLVGNGEDEPRLQRQAEHLGLAGRVHFLGYVPHPEAPRYLSMFDVLILPSETQSNWKEQFGRVLIESMACGTPVIGSDSGEIPNVIRRTRGGLVFPERNPEALASSLARVLNDADLRNRLASRGRETVLEEYTDVALAKRFVTTLQSVPSRALQSA